MIDAAEHSLSLRLDRFLQASQDFDVHIYKKPITDDISSNNNPDQKNFLPYVGNGLLGTGLEMESALFIRQGRTLSLQVSWNYTSQFDCYVKFYCNLNMNIFTLFL